MRVVFWIGKWSPRFRSWYYRRTGKWWWGLILFVQENMVYSERFVEFDDLFKPRVREE